MKKHIFLLLLPTSGGLWKIENAGKEWFSFFDKQSTQSIGNIPAAVSVNDLFIHPRDKKLVIGTYGRSVYILDDIYLFK